MPTSQLAANGTSVDQSPIHTPALPFCHVTLRARKPRDPAFLRELGALGDHVRARRLTLGLLQREAARQIGVGLSTLAK